MHGNAGQLAMRQSGTSCPWSSRAADIPLARNDPLALPRLRAQRLRLMLRVYLQLLKFVGCYHGHADSYLVQAGSGVATLGLPDSPGVPAASTGAFATPV